MQMRSLWTEKKVSTKQVKPVLIAVNKPAGIVCTTARFEGEKNIVVYGKNILLEFIRLAVSIRNLRV